MAKAAPKVPAFGAYLRQQRGSRSRERIVRQMAGVNVVRQQSALAKAETEGRVPAVDLLRGLNAVYRIPFEKLVDKVLQELGVTPVKWRVAERDAPEVVRDADEAELLGLFRQIGEQRRRLMVRDMIARLVDDWADGVPQKGSAWMRGKLIEKPLDEPSIPRRKR